MSVCPDLILRYGAHAEKDYLLKTCKQFNGLHINANLVEISTFATTSLVAVIRTKVQELEFFLNPVTYLFGPYVEPSTGRTKTDLDWIKSKSKKTGIVDIKASYKELAKQFGKSFEAAVNSGVAIDFLDLNDSDINDICEGVIQYQRSRLSGILNSEEIDDFKVLVNSESTTPTCCFAPYFYTADEWRSEGIRANATLSAYCVSNNPDLDIHQLLLLSPSTLHDQSALELIVNGVQESGVQGVWLWISKFSEIYESTESLIHMRALVSELAKHTTVYAYAGGLWSMMLGADGLKGVAHGVGYGEGRNVVSPIGTAAPTVRYYLPPVAKRLGVADIERCFDTMSIESANDFHEQICDCKICKGVLRDDLRRFSLFGEMHRNPNATRDSQTATAAKLCRFHFLLHRLKHDREFVNNIESNKRRSSLLDRAGKWPVQPTVKRECEHIARWAESFKMDTMSLDSAFKDQIDTSTV